MSKRNVRDEFVEHTADKAPVKCAQLILGDDYLDERVFMNLKVNHTVQEYNDFLNQLSKYKYDAGYGGQQLFGTIWYTDKTWSERGEYDGSEWWEYKKSPAIPKDLK